MRTITREVEGSYVVHTGEAAHTLARVRLPNRLSYQPFTTGTTAIRPSPIPMFLRHRRGRYIKLEPVGSAVVRVEQRGPRSFRVAGEVRGLWNVIALGLVAAALGGAFMQGWIRGMIRGVPPDWTAWHWIAIVLLGCLFAGISAFGILIIAVGVSQVRWTRAVGSAAAAALLSHTPHPRPARTDSGGGG